MLELSSKNLPPAFATIISKDLEETLLKLDKIENSSSYNDEQYSEYVQFIRQKSRNIKEIGKQISGTKTVQQHTQDDVGKAMSLFMLDSLDNVTIESLKQIRNRLIKSFHPDDASNNNDYTEKAQQINKSYSILKQYIQSQEGN